MKKLRYNELDEMAWEYEHGCYDCAVGDECGDECWDEACQRELEDETGEGIFGSELKKEPPPMPKAYCTCVSNGTVYGHGEKDEIERVVFNLLEPFKDYHFEFKFFEAK